VPLSVFTSIPESGTTSKRLARLSSWKKPGFALLYDNQIREQIVSKITGEKKEKKFCQVALTHPNSNLEIAYIFITFPAPGFSSPYEKDNIMKKFIRILLSGTMYNTII